MEKKVRAKARKLKIQIELLGITVIFIYSNGQSPRPAHGWDDAWDLLLRIEENWEEIKKEIEYSDEARTKVAEMLRKSTKNIRK